ncbi:RNA-directed DNA polymerase homolog [Rhizophagus irregularis DAOM 181602=DAOM 197198]|nr:RNA-directed DNA polymerase homolog [Rhizophagus irregularis DAOM 181602=DAOM 197198]
MSFIVMVTLGSGCGRVPAENGKDIEIPIEYENNDENINDNNDSDDSEDEDSENEYEETSLGHNNGETLKMHKDWTDEIKYKDLERLQEKELKDLVKEYEDICIYGDKKISKTNIVECNIRRDNTRIIKINQMTITDAYPLPRIDDLLEKFRVAKWFTTIDLASGYWQIEMKEEDKEKTAFICSQGLYEFNVMPFGLKNAPAIFQRTMNKIFKEYLDKFMNVYIDDIIIYSKNWDEHLQHIKIVLEELRKANMMLKLKKCEWAKKNVKYLGHIVGTDGLKPDNKHRSKSEKSGTNRSPIR